VIARVFLFKSVRKRRGNSEKNRHSPVCSKKRACAMHYAEEGNVQDGVSQSGRHCQGGNIRQQGW